MKKDQEIFDTAKHLHQSGEIKEAQKLYIKAQKLLLNSNKKNQFKQILLII